MNIDRQSRQFEELISSTIEETKDIPEIISETGKINMPHKGTHPRSTFIITVDHHGPMLTPRWYLYLLC